MRKRIGKTGVILLSVITSTALSGCFELGDPADASTNVPPPGGPPSSDNRAPTISGNPSAFVMVGNSYLFTPIASDADGDPLTFSISNKPAWADFNSANGSLTGLASLGSEGTYADIQITVTDGQATAALPQFAIDVVQTTLGSAVLSWTAPTVNADGSTLTDLAGFKLYYGTAPGSYPNQILIDNPGVTTFVVENLIPDTYYFVSTAFNTNGFESDFSNMATKIVN